MDLKKKKFLVTGGSSGIGKAIAEALIDEGAEVAITGRNAEKLHLTAKELGAFPIAKSADNENDILETFAIIKEKWGTLDGLINNAGIGYMKPLQDVLWSDFEKIFSTNVFGASMMAKYAVEIFKTQNKHGNIVNIASTAGSKGFANGSVYSASKFALRGLTQCWQAELRPHNIRVFLVNPSEVTTAFAQESRNERAEVDNKLRGKEIADAIIGALKMDDRGFIPELTVWATNPF